MSSLHYTDHSPRSTTSSHHKSQYLLLPSRSFYCRESKIKRMKICFNIRWKCCCVLELSKGLCEILLLLILIAKVGIHDRHRKPIREKFSAPSYQTKYASEPIIASFMRLTYSCCCCLLIRTQRFTGNRNQMSYSH